MTATIVAVWLGGAAFSLVVWPKHREALLFGFALAALALGILACEPPVEVFP